MLHLTVRACVCVGVCVCVCVCVKCGCECVTARRCRLPPIQQQTTCGRGLPIINSRSGISCRLRQSNPPSRVAALSSRQCVKPANTHSDNFTSHTADADADAAPAAAAAVAAASNQSLDKLPVAEEEEQQTETSEDEIEILTDGDQVKASTPATPPPANDATDAAGVQKDDDGPSDESAQRSSQFILININK